MRTITLRTMHRLALMTCLLASLTGCGGVSDQPDLGRVTGKVTLDGEPLEGVIVNFQPEKGRAATDETDAEGNYDLIYIYGSMGAKIGKNTVSFRWPDGVEGKKPIPAKYGGKSDLTVEVKGGFKGGRNKFDWELKSK